MMCWIATLVLLQVACALRAPVARHPHAQRSVAQRMERLGDGEQTRGTLVGEGGVGVAAAAAGSDDEEGRRRRWHSACSRLPRRRSRA